MLLVRQRPYCENVCDLMDRKHPANLHIIEQSIFASLSGARCSLIHGHQIRNQTTIDSSVCRCWVIRQPRSIASNVRQWPNGVSTHAPSRHPGHHQVCNRRAQDWHQCALRNGLLGVAEITGDISPRQNSRCRREEDGKNRKERVSVAETRHKVGTKCFHWNTNALITLHCYISVQYVHIRLRYKICNNVILRQTSKITHVQKQIY